MFARTARVAVGALARRPAVGTVARVNTATACRFTATATPSCIRAFSTAASSTPAANLADDGSSHSDFAPKMKAPTGSSSAAASSNASSNSSRISSSASDAQQLIQSDISSHDVFLYMKGTPSQPQCGFSANVCRILAAYPGVKYGSRNVLEDDFVREGIKKFSDWPTLPQLFIKGEFVGGSDIVGNMYKSGELDKLLGQSPAKKA